MSTNTTSLPYLAVSISNRVNYGLFFGGMYIAAILFGITIVQASTFFFVHRRDPILHKAVVTALLIFDMTHLALVANSFFNYVVVHSGDKNPPAVTWSCVAFYVLENITIAIAHLGKGALKRAQVIILQFLVASSLVSGLYVAARLARRLGLQQSSFIDVFSESDLFPMNVLNLSLNCVVDIAVVAILTPELSHQTTVSWTTSTFMLIIAYALNTGIFNLIFSLGAIIAFISWRHSLLFLAPRIILMTVHVNSLMAMFNARHYFRPRATNTVILQAHDASITVSKVGGLRVKSLRTTHDDGPTVNTAGLPLFTKHDSEIDLFRPSQIDVNIHTTQDKRVSPSRDYPYSLPHYF
ncbi:hypothetical protein ONZ45_g1616 [Pleurotus djamor]|nr:hypothetical protein ONZ45_g1616 [Pleurotus djamor]